MSYKNLEERMKAAGGAVKMLRNSQSGPNPYPVKLPEYTQLARRAVGLAEHGDPVQPVVSHDRPVRVRSGRVRASREPRHQQLQGLHARQGQAVRARHLGRLSSSATSSSATSRRISSTSSVVRRLPTGCSTTARRARRKTAAKWNVKFERDERSASRPNPDRAQDLPLPGAGSERDEGDDEGARRRAAGSQVLQHDRGDDRRQEGHCAASRHGRPAGLRTVRTGRRTARPCSMRSSKAGKEFGLRLVGARAYSSNTLESGWIPWPDGRRSTRATSA